jgi:hypothetical protein
MYISWKWSIGEAYYKSARQEKKEAQNQNQNQNYEQNYDSQINAINQSLADYSTDSDLINITNSMFSRNQNQSGTRREDIDLKMADRQMISQRGVNPFMQTSYVNDVVARDMFLKPINTTFERVKEEE